MLRFLFILLLSLNVLSHTIGDEIPEDESRHQVASIHSECADEHDSEHCTRSHCHLGHCQLFLQNNFIDLDPIAYQHRLSFYAKNLLSFERPLDIFRPPRLLVV